MTQSDERAHELVLAIAFSTGHADDLALRDFEVDGSKARAASACVRRQHDRFLAGTRRLIGERQVRADADHQRHDVVDVPVLAVVRALNPPIADHGQLVSETLDLIEPMGDVEDRCAVGQRGRDMSDSSLAMLAASSAAVGSSSNRTFGRWMIALTTSSSCLEPGLRDATRSSGPNDRSNCLRSSPIRAQPSAEPEGRHPVV